MKNFDELANPKSEARKNNIKTRAKELLDGRYRLSDIVCNLVYAGGGQAVYYKEQIIFDMNIQDIQSLILDSLIIPEGWHTPITDSQQLDISARWSSNGEYEVTVIVTKDDEDS